MEQGVITYWDATSKKLKPFSYLNAISTRFYILFTTITMSFYVAMVVFTPQPWTLLTFRNVSFCELREKVPNFEISDAYDINS